jgi:hypothetical protein
MGTRHLSVDPPWSVGKPAVLALSGGKDTFSHDLRRLGRGEPGVEAGDRWRIDLDADVDSVADRP